MPPWARPSSPSGTRATPGGRCSGTSSHQPSSSRCSRRWRRASCSRRCATRSTPPPASLLRRRASTWWVDGWVGGWVGGPARLCSQDLPCERRVGVCGCGAAGRSTDCLRTACEIASATWPLPPPPQVWSALVRGTGSQLAARNLYNVRDTGCSACYAYLDQRLEAYVAANRCAAAAGAGEGRWRGMPGAPSLLRTTLRTSLAWEQVR